MVSVAQLNDVMVRRGEKTLLDSVSLQVNEGERWVVLGPNGAGKSTFLHVLATRIYPTSGTVSLLEEKMGKTDVFEVRPFLGLASQQLAESMPENEKVIDVVMTASYSVVGRWNEDYDAEDHERAHSLLSVFGVEHLAERSFGALSTGEKKRVLSARALMTDPELLLLDEPAAGLDVGGREELVRSLSTLAQDPATPVTVLVTHHLEEIPAGYTHALLLRDGAVVASGAIGDTLTSQNLTRVFGMPLVVEETDGRWTARALSPAF